MNNNYSEAVEAATEIIEKRGLGVGFLLADKRFNEVTADILEKKNITNVQILEGRIEKDGYVLSLAVLSRQYLFVWPHALARVESHYEGQEVLIFVIMIKGEEIVLVYDKKGEMIPHIPRKD